MEPPENRDTPDRLESELDELEGLIPHLETKRIKGSHGSMYLIHEMHSRKEIEGIKPQLVRAHNLIARRGILPQDIPEDTTSFYLEESVNFSDLYSYYVQNSPSQTPLNPRVFQATIRQMAIEGRASQTHEQGYFRKLREMGAPILIGDISTSSTPDSWWISNANREQATYLVRALQLVTLIALVNKGVIKQEELSVLSDPLDARTALDEIPHRIDRRQFLKLIAGATTAFVVSQTALRWLKSPGEENLAAEALKGWQRNEQELKRLVDRHGLESLFHPENLNVTFRNILVADFLLLYQEKKPTKSPVTAVNYGAAHGGIQQFYKLGSLLGRKFLHSLLLSYPQEILRKLVEENGDMMLFASFHEFQIEPQETDNVTATLDRVYTDMDLVRGIIDKLDIKVAG